MKKFAFLRRYMLCARYQVKSQGSISAQGLCAKRLCLPRPVGAMLASVFFDYAFTFAARLIGDTRDDAADRQSVLLGIQNT